MATVAESLFGVTPESLMAQREQQLQQRALQFAQLDPMQAAQAGFYMAGSRLGGAVGGLLGAGDPELMRVRQRQQLLQGVDPSNPGSLREAAQKAMQAGDFQAAQMLTARALETEQAASNVSLRRAQEAKIVGATQREEQLRQALAGLSPDATDKDIQAVVRQYGDPDKIFAALERSQKAEADRAAKTELEREKLAQREREMEMRREQMAANNALRAATTDIQRQVAQARLDTLLDKKAEKQEKQEAAKTMALNHAGKVIGDVQAATSLVTGSTTGLLGKGQAYIPGTTAYDLNQRLLTIKANLGFDRLQQMRDASPTGGALGQVAVQELNALQSTVGSLEIGQSKAELQKNLNKIDHHYSNWVRVTNGEQPISFEDYMKTKQTAPAAAPAAAGGAGSWSIRPR